MQQFFRKVGMLSAIVLFNTSVVASETSKKMAFTSPENAVEELVSSVKENNRTKLIRILGSDAKPLFESGDKSEDKTIRKQFIKAYESANQLEKINNKKYMLIVGDDNWQFPIPIVRESNRGWEFDTAAGKEEILNRRVGLNELSVIKALHAYVDAQHDYYLTNPQNNKHLSYAQTLFSSPGKRDGLFYPVKEGESLSPLGEIYAKADKKPYFGYYFRVLNSQGPHAKGGAIEYSKQGMLGHALIAWPAKYGNTGVMTFMVNQDGVVYEKDLGSQTSTVVHRVNQFNPDKTWKEAKDPQR
jgi:hypothetical protein